MIDSESIKNTIGLRIKELRNIKDITQEALAESLGLQPNTIAKMETGKLYPKPETIAKLSNYFKVTPAIFFMSKVQLNLEENINYVKKIDELLTVCDTKSLKILHNTAIILVNNQ